MFAYALGEGWIDANPVTGIRTPAVGRRSGHLKQKEIGAFWIALGESGMPENARLGTQFLFLAGLRLNEANIKREWVHWNDPEHGDHIEIPASVMKSKRAHLLPVCAKLKGIIEIGLASHNGVNVFAGKPKRWSEHFRSHRASMEFPTLTFHDFRRSFNTEAQRQRIPQRYIDAALSHTIITGVEGHYNMYEFSSEKREALECWEKAIQDFATEVRRSRIQVVQA